jgi:hypothetical protein
MKLDRTQLIFYVLGFLALVYLVLPHIVEGYESYARPWDTAEDKITEKTVDDGLEHMTNRDVDVKQTHYSQKPDMWELFQAASEPKKTTLVLPSEPTKTLPGVPTPSKSEPIGPSNKKEVEPPIDRDEYNTPTDSATRTLDPEVQKPSGVPEHKDKKKEPRRKIMKQSVQEVPTYAPKKSKEGIWGPRAPELDKSQPRPKDSGDSSKTGSGVYPDIYGPEQLKVPGGGEEDSSNPSFYDYVPAAEFPAGPLFPSPYLNDFSKILKT